MYKTKMILFLIFVLVPSMAYSQQYFNISEVQEQVKSRWTETYSDFFGRTVEIDADVQVFGQGEAPVLKVKIPDYNDLDYSLFDEGTQHLNDHGFTIWKNNPADPIFQTKGGEQTLIVHRSYFEKVDMDKIYAPEYGTNLTMQHMVDRLSGIMRRQEKLPSDFMFDRPFDFSVRCKVKKDSGEVVEPAAYMAHFWQTMHGLPIIGHASIGFEQTSGIVYYPGLMLSMRGDDEHSIGLSALEEAEMLVQDIPLCSFEQVTKSLQALIENGVIRKIFEIQLGYVLYNDPNVPDSVRSAYDAEYYYLVPTWCVNCIWMENPKKEYAVKAKLNDELNWDERSSSVQYKTILVNAQTGEVFNRNNRKHGNTDYTGFISWDEVK